MAMSASRRAHCSSSRSISPALAWSRTCLYAASCFSVDWIALRYCSCCCASSLTLPGSSFSARSIFFSSDGTPAISLLASRMPLLRSFVSAPMRNVRPLYRLAMRPPIGFVKVLAEQAVDVRLGGFPRPCRPAIARPLGCEVGEGDGVVVGHAPNVGRGEPAATERQDGAPGIPAIRRAVSWPARPLGDETAPPLRRSRSPPRSRRRRRG